MIKYEASVLNQFDSEDSGNAFVGVSVTVRKSQTGEKATLYSDNGLTEIENPTTTNNLGDYSFYIPQGEYSIILDEGGEFQKKLEKVFIGSGSGLTVNTESELLKSSNPIGDKVSLSESGNPSYIVMPPTTVMQAGDKKADNGNVLSLQPNDDGSFDVRWFGAVSGGSSSDNLASFNKAAERAGNKGLCVVPSGSFLLSGDVSTKTNWILHPNAIAGSNSGVSPTFETDTSRLNGTMIRIDGSEQFNTMTVGDTGYAFQKATGRGLTAEVRGLSNNGKGGLVGATLSSGSDSNDQGCIAVGAYGLNDNSNLNRSVWGIYSEVRNTPAGGGNCIGVESGVANFKSTVNTYPSNLPQLGDGISATFWGSAGFSSSTANVSAWGAMVGVANAFTKGIVVYRNAIVSGPELKEVIASSENTGWSWYPDNSTTTMGYMRGIDEGGQSFRWELTLKDIGVKTSKISANANSMIVSDNAMTLGTAGGRWSEVFSVNGAINTSDEREKQQVRDLSEVEKTVAMQIKGMVKGFKWNHAVDEKGDDARWHFGVMAQQVAQAFTDNGLDPEHYGMFCYDEWQEDEEAGVSAGNRYGVRYNELIMFILGAL